MTKSSKVNSRNRNNRTRLNQKNKKEKLFSYQSSNYIRKEKKKTDMKNIPKSPSDKISSSMDNVLDFDYLIESLQIKKNKYYLKPLRPMKYQRKKDYSLSNDISRRDGEQNISNNPKDEIEFREINKKVKVKSSLYDINNFYSASSVKINEKKEVIKIVCPSYRELSTEEMWTKDDNDTIKDKKKDMSDAFYLSFHQKFENEERNNRLQLFSTELKKKKDKNNHCGSISCLSDSTDINYNLHEI